MSDLRYLMLIIQPVYFRIQMLLSKCDRMGPINSILKPVYHFDSLTAYSAIKIKAFVYCWSAKLFGLE